MNLFELLLLGVGLSMDAFAVSICKGLACRNVKFRHLVIPGLWFGGFQALMPTIGFFLGSTFEKHIDACDHWVAFALLAFIGAKMIKDSFSCECEKVNNNFGFKCMLILAVATSIDALAVGVTFALLQEVNVPVAVTAIGITTFLFSAAGVKIGNIFGTRYKSKAERLGGVILILIGLKILIQGL